MNQDADAEAEVHVYSIGHSDHAIEAFLTRLRQHEIALVVDVRSQPYSQWVPQFNRESLMRDLEAAGIHYMFIGDSLGGRPSDRSMYDPGQELPNYGRVADDPGFQAGILQLMTMAATERTVVMCAEGDHRTCHRSKLITPALLKRHVQVFHIQSDGQVVRAEPEPEQLSFF